MRGGDGEVSVDHCDAANGAAASGAAASGAAGSGSTASGAAGSVDGDLPFSVDAGKDISHDGFWTVTLATDLRAHSSSLASCDMLWLLVLVYRVEHSRRARQVQAVSHEPTLAASLRFVTREASITFRISSCSRKCRVSSSSSQTLANLKARTSGSRGLPDMYFLKVEVQWEGGEGGGIEGEEEVRPNATCSNCLRLTACQSYVESYRGEVVQVDMVQTPVAVHHPPSIERGRREG